MMSASQVVNEWRQTRLSGVLCFYCGCELLKEHRLHSPFNKSTDHVIPQRLGVKWSYNTVKTCAGCNGAKNGSELHEFRKWYGKPFFFEEALFVKVDEIWQIYTLHRDLEEMIDLAFSRTRNRIQQIYKENDKKFLAIK